MLLALSGDMRLKLPPLQIPDIRVENDYPPSPDAWVVRGGY
jgi:hypothetical protein